MQIQTVRPNAISIVCYENHVPPFAAAVLNRLYQSLFSSLSQYRLYDCIDNISTYVARSDGQVVALFLFRMEHSRVSVCNEVIKLDAEEASRFAQYIFEHYAQVSMISFRAVETNICRLPFPSQRINFLEDIVLTLPASVEDYVGSLGKATRRTIRHNMNRLMRAFPSFRFRVSETSKIDERDIVAIVRMNHARMAGKDKVSVYTESETRRICQLARVCGLVGVLMVDGQVCAGAVSFRIGEHYYMSISAHDPLYDEYRLGTLSGFLNISECIRRGGKECHLLWGQHEYKYRFLGVRRALDNVNIYRSGFAVLRHADTVLRMVASGSIRRLRLWLHEARRRDSLAWRALTVLSNSWRRLNLAGPKRS